MEDDLPKPKMIPTGYKVKLPHTLSYSCSAKTLSLAWQDVPQFDNFDLLFLCDVPRELHKNNGMRYVLWVDYSRMHPTSLPRLWREREGGKWMWNIHVGVCRREDAHEVREWLRSTGLEQARVWLEHKARFNSERLWAVSFNEDSRAFHVTHG